jgi:phage portal protein BeeE
MPNTVQQPASWTHTILATALLQGENVTIKCANEQDAIMIYQRTLELMQDTVLTPVGRRYTIRHTKLTQKKNVIKSRPLSDKGKLRSKKRKQ